MNNKKANKSLEWTLLTSEALRGSSLAAPLSFCVARREHFAKTTKTAWSKKKWGLAARDGEPSCRGVRVVRCRDWMAISAWGCL